MTTLHRIRAWADIDLAALQHNLQVVRQHNDTASVTAIVKANAYGHGVSEVARALGQGSRPVDRFGVATVDEAVELNALGLGRPILVLQGAARFEQLRFLVEAGIEFVIHSDYQLAMVQRLLREHPAARLPTVWVKLDTGMHRLGMVADEFHQVITALDALPQVRQVVAMSHLASADAPQEDAAVRQTTGQLERFLAASDPVCAEPGSLQVTRSLAASAGILAWPATHFDHLRPGIMLYGSSPFGHRTGPELGLRPVMTLKARLLAVKQVAAGGSIGYGATFTCEEPTRIGVVSIGYADGYPRSAPTGTPVLLATPQGYQRTRLVGRVSMDMITIDLNGFAGAEVGDEVILWGEGLPADEVARFAQTISYELFCRVTRRVAFHYT